MPNLDSLNADKTLKYSDKGKRIAEIIELYNGIDAELFYSLEGIIYCIRINKGSVLLRKANYKNREFKEEKDKTVIDILKEMFFYTISVNYSLYGLNEKHLGSWVKYLYHKNDSYQTPIVINPFRKDGQIDVNNELHLAQSRLLSNLIDDTFTTNEIINDKEVCKIKFIIDSTELYYPKSLAGGNDISEEEIHDYWWHIIDKIKIDSKMNFEDLISVIYNLYYNKEEVKMNFFNNEYFVNLVKYTITKIIKVCENYFNSKTKKLITELLNDDSNENKFEILKNLIEIIKDDRSHITLKLRQALNSLRFNLLKEDSNKGIIWYESENKFAEYFIVISIDEFIKRIKASKEKDPTLELIELLPIACYKSELGTKSGESETGEIYQLSSGEQHFIHSLQSVFYHISNLNSVHESKENKLKYEYLNLIFDEIELYYHPELQRNFIFELLKGFSKMDIPNIKGINIIFCTHSPLILSDITKECTLKLEDGQIMSSSKKNSFGANIHDLLDDDFFLNNGFMGEFAKTKIESLIDYLEKNENLDFVEKGWNKESSRKFIEIIGEPILKSTLWNLHLNKYKNRIEIEEQIKELTNQLKKIEQTNSKDDNVT